MSAFLKSKKKSVGFTIVEILVTLAIVSLLVSLFVPAAAKIHDIANRLRQRGQFTSIELGLESFMEESALGDYPPSYRMQAEGTFCSGAQILGEAMLGHDGFGIHQYSSYRADGTSDPSNTVDYYIPITTTTETAAENLSRRKGPYLENEVANGRRLGDIYDATTNINANTSADTMVLADMYSRDMETGFKSGMPILYFRAEDFNTLHVAQAIGFNNINIYNVEHNGDLIGRNVPWGTDSHAMNTDPPTIFYRDTQDVRFTAIARPYRLSSFILLSAGKDGRYGTADDVYNFDRPE